MTTPSITERLEAATVKAEGASQIMYDVANGGPAVEVPTESGPVPSLQKWYADLNDRTSGAVGQVEVRLDDVEQQLGQVEEAAQQLEARTTQMEMVFGTRALAVAALPDLVPQQLVVIAADEEHAGRRTRNAVNEAGDGVVFVGFADISDVGVPQTSSTGAAIIPGGPESDRPDPALHANQFLFRGNADTGKLEWYNLDTDEWDPIVDAVRLGEALQAFISSNHTFTAAQRGAIVALADGVTIAPDMNAGNFFSVTLGGNRTLANPTNMTPGQSGSIFITQDATGGRMLGYGSFWDFEGGVAPVLSTGANKVDRLDYLVRTSTSIHAVLSKDWS